MRHSALIRTLLPYARCTCETRSAQHGQGIPTPDFPFKRPLRQQHRRASTFNNVAAGEHGSPSDQQGRRRPMAPRTGANQKSQTPTEIPLPAHRQYDHLACLVRIKPQPTSTIYTTPILTHFQRHFGSVLEFRHLDGGAGGSLRPPNQASGKVFHTRFADESSVLKALAASPLTINVGSSAAIDKGNGSNQDVSASGEIAAADASNGRSANIDPYDMISLKHHHKPPPCTFTCTIQRVPPRRAAHSPPQRTLPPRQALVRHKATQVLYESLCAGGLPADRAWVLALEPQDLPQTQEAQTTGRAVTNEAAEGEVQQQKRKAKDSARGARDA